MKTAPRSKAVVAVDLGGTKLATGVFDSDGTLLYKAIIAVNRRGGSTVGAATCSEISKALQFARKRKISTHAIGISVPGVAREDSTVWAPNIRGWENYPLREEIQKIARKIPVRIESDRVCYIMGERWKGAAQGCANAIFLAVGTGIGAGIIVDGRVVRGADGIAGAIGWMGLRQPFLGGYKECGCFEYHSSGRGLAKLAGCADARKVFKESQSTVVREAIVFWGMAAANLVSLFNPEKIIFGGGVFGPARELLEQIRGESTKWAQPLAMKRVVFEISKLGGDAGLYGAACVANFRS